MLKLGEHILNFQIEPNNGFLVTMVIHRFVLITINFQTKLYNILSIGWHELFHVLALVKEVDQPLVLAIRLSTVSCKNMNLF